MWLQEVEEIFKGYLPYYILIFLPIFIIVSPANPVLASSEFPVYRMPHYDLHGISHGCRSAGINLEAKSLTNWNNARHCVVTNFKSLTVDSFKNIKSKAGALLAMLPEHLSTLSSEEYQHLLLLENIMLAQEVTIPVYFVKYSPELKSIIEDIESNIEDNLSKSATEAMINSIAGNGYQIIISASTPTVRTDARIATIHGQLSGYSADGKIPTIAVVAYYDSFGVAPELSFGADSNGSGVVILLELVRIFSTLYADQKTRGRYNIVFVLSGGGKMNYQGSKKWLEEQLDSVDGSIIQEVSYVMCLDTLAANDSIYLHVSKPPKEGSPTSQFYKELKSAASNIQPSASVEGVHKKINLADDILGWEHERFSIRRLPAFTISTLKTHRDFRKSTIMDTWGNLNMERLVKNTNIVAEALARHIYGESYESVFGSSLKISRKNIESWANTISSEARSPQLISTKDNPLVASFKQTFNEFLREVKVTVAVPDKRDPDFQFYHNTGGVVNVYSVKPAIFDLVLTIAIVLYLVIIYFLIERFPALYKIACSFTANKKIKSN
ncbi:BOS complex subunit NCLN [Diabrotica undecimpunctata]|uniref:BOS complex subunit NCLN n=1 Tax=Diabrotica undecimpunctata TaxID=50387 RepID=UPI003B63283E